MEKLWLKAKDEQALIDALPFARGIDLDGNPSWITDTNLYILAILGKLNKGTGKFVEDVKGFPYEVKTPIPGYHANMKVTPEIAAKISKTIQIPKPNNSRRKWAGE